MYRYRLHVEEDNRDWRNVTGPDGKLLTFETEDEARAKLEELFAVLVKMERYAGPKRAHVIVATDPVENTLT